jgi:hypothetical protein
MRVEFAESAREVTLLPRADRLFLEEQDEMLLEGFADRRDRRFIVIAREVDILDERAECGRQRLDRQPRARPRSDAG